MLAQGAGAPALLERLKEDPNALKLEFTIDTIEGTYLGLQMTLDASEPGFKPSRNSPTRIFCPSLHDLRRRSTSMGRCRASSAPNFKSCPQLLLTYMAFDPASCFFAKTPEKSCFDFLSASRPSYPLATLSAHRRSP